MAEAPSEPPPRQERARPSEKWAFALPDRDPSEAERQPQLPTRPEEKWHALLRGGQTHTPSVTAPVAESPEEEKPEPQSADAGGTPIPGAGIVPVAVPGEILAIVLSEVMEAGNIPPPGSGDAEAGSSAELTEPTKLPTNADKGELIWEADLIVRENAGEGATTTPTGPDAEPEPDPGPPSKTEIGVIEKSSQGNASEKDRRDGDQAEEPTPVLAAERKATPEIHSAIPSPTHLGPSDSKIPTPLTDAAAIAPAAGVDMDGAKKLRPSQIATLYVDVPGTATGDAAALRLAVTQRGDQVSVRLRSWDSGAGELGHERMQPLLQSLAEKGFENTIAPAHGREKAAPAAEASSAQNDQQSYSNADHRQQKNQERQQALFVRRQMRRVQSEQFELPPSQTTSRNISPHGDYR